MKKIIFFILIINFGNVNAQGCEDFQSDLYDYKVSSVKNLSEGAKSELIGNLISTGKSIAISMISPSEIHTNLNAYANSLSDLHKYWGKGEIPKVKSELRNLQIAQKGILIERDITDPECIEALKKLTSFYTETISNLYGNNCDSDFNFEVETNEYGSEILVVKPNGETPCGHEISENSSRVWGILICYYENGKQKVARQDMTYDIIANGFYDFYLGKNISNLKTEFFDASMDPETYPEKACN